MSAVIQNQVVRLLRDAIAELKVSPEALTTREIIGLSVLAQEFDRTELRAVLLRESFGRRTSTSG